LVVTADHGEAHIRPQGIERHRDTFLIVLESTKSLRLCFHGLADVGQPSADRIVHLTRRGEAYVLWDGRKSMDAVPFAILEKAAPSKGAEPTGEARPATNGLPFLK
jgi:hypothetical protein